MVTIYDIARRARVSHVTVSNVLNRHKYGEVSARTAERIRRIARQLGYEPNQAARNLRLGKTSIISLLTWNSFLYADVTELVEEINSILTTHQYHLSLEMLHWVKDLQPALQLVGPGHCDGVFVLGFQPQPELHEHLRRLRQRGFAVVVKHRALEGLDTVNWDEAEGARLAVAHLMQRAGPHVTMVYGITEGADASRVVGYRQAMKTARVPVDPRRLVQWKVEGDAAELWRHLVSSPPRPQALFVYNEELAIRLANVICAAGLKIPQDIAMATYRSRRLTLSPVPFMTIDHHPAELAKLMVQRLLAQIADPSIKPSHTWLQPVLAGIDRHD